MILDKLLEWPKKKVLTIIIIVGVVAFLLLQVIGMGPIEQSLKASTGYGVMEFEFAWNPEGINAIFEAWGAEGKAQEALVTYLDFLYIFAYVAFIAGFILLITRSLEEKAQTLGLWITLTPIIAGAFDVVENFNLLLMLNDSAFIYMGSPFIASLFATMKFTLLFIGIIFFFAALVIVLIQRRNK